VKRFRKISLWILGILLFLIAQGFFLIYIFEDDIKDAAVAKINTYLKTEVKVGHISFSVFEHFPYASVKFPDLQIKEGIEGSSKNLVTAKEISLLFNIWDLYYKNYTIKKLYIENAQVDIYIDAKGNDNFHFWKETKSTGKDDFRLNVEEIILKNVSIRFDDRYRDQYYAVRFDKSELKGNFSSDQFKLDVKGKLFVNKIIIEKTTYLTNKNVEADATLDINLARSVYTFDHVNLGLEELQLSIKGFVEASIKRSYVDLDITGSKATLQSFTSLLPQRYADHFKNYKSSGDFYFNIQLIGNYGRNHNPHITGIAGVKNGSVQISNEKINAQLTSVQLDLIYTNGNLQTPESSSLEIKNFSGALEGRPFRSSFKMQNFSDPYIDLSIEANWNLKDIQALIPGDAVTIKDGTIDMKASFSGLLKNFKDENAIEKIKSEGYLQLKGAAFSVTKSDLDFNHFNGRFNFRNNDMQILDFSGKISESDFRLNGYFRNLLAYLLLKDQPLEIDAKLSSSKINLDQLLAVSASVSSSSDTVYYLKINPKLICNLRADIDYLNFERFSAKNIQGIFQIKDQTFSSDHLSFNALSGDILTKLYVDASYPDHIVVNIDASMRSVKIRQMFYEFKNFTQDVLTDKNLKGDLTASVKINSVWGKDLKADLNKFYAKGKILIENGELIDFEPMLALAKFIDVNELKALKFSALENDIEIKEQTIFIPSMDIQSNALNLKLSGTHTFQNTIDYHMNMLLSQLIKKKSNKLGDEQFGEIEDDGSGRTTLFIRMYGDASNPKFSLDKKAIQQKIADDLKQEKQEVKGILKQELNSIFKKDQQYRERVNEEGADWEKDIPGGNNNIQKTNIKENDIPAKSDTTKKKSRLQKLKDKLKEPAENDL
jgi:hypothetical protein